MGRLKIQKPGPEKEGGVLKTVIALVLSFLLLGLAVWVYFRAFPGKMPSEIFEISSFNGDVQVYDKESGRWVMADRGRQIRAGERLRTGEGAEADLEVAEKIRVRVKQNSEFGFLGAKAYDKNPYIRLQLEKGEMMAATQKGFGEDRLDIETPHLTAQSHGGYFRVRTNPEARDSWLGLMRGKAQVRSNELFAKETVEIQGLEVVESVKGQALGEVRRVSREEWNDLSEIYQLTVKSAALEAEQLDLSKEAGSLFDFVFDHGTFYTPELGYAIRDFFKDESAGEVFLEVEYDVFPRGSFVGMYIKTRELDLSEYSHLEFEMRQVADEGYPQAIRVELKSRSGVVRAFAAKLPRPVWEKVSFPIHVKDPLEATEVAFVFLHDRVGEYKKGSVQFRALNLVKAEKKEQAPVPPAPVPVSITSPEETVAAQPESETVIEAPVETPRSAEESTEAIDESLLSDDGWAKKVVL